MEILFDLDENQRLPQRITFTQDFRDVHSKCWVVLPYPAKVNFAEGFGFIYKGIQWEAVSYKRIDREGEYFLSIMGYPKCITSYIDTKHESLKSLANKVGIPFSRNSTDFKFEYPLRNILLGPMLYKYRYSSLEINREHLANGWFIFIDERGLWGQSYGEILRDKVLEYDTNFLAFSGGAYSFIRDYLSERYQRDHPPKVIGYKSILNGMIGDKFDVDATIPGLVGFKYKLSGTDQSLFKDYDNLVLIRQRYDSAKSPLPWALTFGQLMVSS